MNLANWTNKGGLAVTEYKCPACSAALVWDAALGKLHCASCGNEYELEAMEALAEADEAQESFDWSAYKEGLSGETMSDTVVYVCRSCGATIETDATTAATRCPYCDNEVVLDDRVEGGLKPNGVIPFKISAKELPGVVKKFYEGKRLLPKNFFDNSKLQEIQGLYVPFWLFDGQMEGGASLDGEIIRSYVEGDYNVTETQHFLLQREGGVRFQHVPVDGSTKLSDDLMDSLEPYDFSELVPFNGGYLAGFVADRFDSDPDAELPRAQDRMKSTAESLIMQTTMGFSGVRLRSNGMNLHDAAVKYVLLPVYLINCAYHGQTYQYAVNGQTGKVVGTLPVSNSRKWAWFFGVFAAVFAAVFAIGMLLQ